MVQSFITVRLWAGWATVPSLRFLTCRMDEHREPPGRSAEGPMRAQQYAVCH